MLRKTPMARAGEKPRRNEGRVTHERTKPKAGQPATREEGAHMAQVATMGCCVCRQPATVHHVTSDGFQRIARSHRRVVPLCPRHHLIQHGPETSVEALGHAGFTATYGIDLLALADRLWCEGVKQ